MKRPVATEGMKSVYDHTLDGFPERIYVSSERDFGTYGDIIRSTAHDDLDDAVIPSTPVEVGIYQLVRTAKFQRQPVEIPKAIVKEVK